MDQYGPSPVAFQSSSHGFLLELSHCWKHSKERFHVQYLPITHNEGLRTTGGLALDSSTCMKSCQTWKTIAGARFLKHSPSQRKSYPNTHSKPTAGSHRPWTVCSKVELGSNQTTLPANADQLSNTVLFAFLPTVANLLQAHLMH